MRAPLSVSLPVVRGSALTQVSRHVSGLRFTKLALGGVSEVSFSLAMPTDRVQVTPADYVAITDARTGRVVADGYLERPEPVTMPGRSEFTVTALGPQVLLTDETRPLLYVDGAQCLDSSSWRRMRLNTPGATADVGDDPIATEDTDAVPAVVIQFPSGLDVTGGSKTAMVNTRARHCGTTLHRVGMQNRGGKDDANFEARVGTRKAGSGVTRVDHLCDPLGNTLSFFANAWADPAIGTLPVDHDEVRLMLVRVAGGATTITGDSTWLSYLGVYIMGALLRLDGSTRTAADSIDPDPAVRADMVVEDLLARMMGGKIDLTTAVVEQTNFEIDQLTYYDGTTPRSVLDDLTLWEHGYRWSVGARTHRGHAFEWKAWPTTPRYVLSERDEFTETGAEADLCNRIAVFWTDPTGQERSVVVTRDVPALGDRVRDAEPLHLPDGFGSSKAATRIGGKVLDQLADPPKAGTVKVSRKIMDHQVGRMVEPWEIEPGCMVLRHTGELLRMTEMSYEDDAYTATLVLGEPARTFEQRVSRLTRHESDPARRRGKKRRGGKKRKGRK